LGKLIKESGGKSQIYAAKPRNDKFNQINCWIEEINKRINSKNVIDFIYDISKDDLLSKYFYIENISKEINKHDVLIVCAGMEGALATVVGGLLAQPIIAVPVSVGYGVSKYGETALNSMLSSCSPGIAVMNIDNGYGAAMAALRIIKNIT